MKNGAREIIGKQISGVIIKERKAGPGHPHTQLFLVFSDGTYYEFYSRFGDISPTGGVCKGGFQEVAEYMKESMRSVWAWFQGGNG